ncbi:lipopolysaccharide-assembly, LptC-related protein [Methylobacterium sp. BTF04]|uniref:lipopolysaccharide-assembly, LptC-related protein n=1 Tax=Methylobacterium sp. BTF04 TaxID=2708300 RepID=UPI0013D08FCB|nr:lipopolysaccharide-assembly, LptC-related protein [Methylobacterium sp. BTF04]NEU10773.1 lipopolysaccharide-assembly, LptC-related protein [Methylobacterium sp. BTF04]
MQVVDALAINGSAGPRADALRTRAHARARNHSAQVRRLRRLIPLAAGSAVVVLAVATLFNPFGHIVPGVSFGPVSLSGTKVKMESPRLSGFRKGDRGYEVTATAAFQDVRKPSLIELQAMKGHLNTDDKGGIAHLEAASGLFDSARESLGLETDIRIWTDKGEEIRLKTADVDFKAGTVRSNEAVAVTIPSGTVAADTLDVTDSGHIISFIGNVHTVLHETDKHEADKAPTADKVADAAARIRTTSAEPSDGDVRR